MGNKRTWKESLVTQSIRIPEANEPSLFLIFCLFFVFVLFACFFLLVFLGFKVDFCFCMLFIFIVGFLFCFFCFWFCCFFWSFKIKKAEAIRKEKEKKGLKKSLGDKLALIESGQGINIDLTPASSCYHGMLTPSRRVKRKELLSRRAGQWQSKREWGERKRNEAFKMTKNQARQSEAKYNDEKSGGKIEVRFARE